MEKKTVVITGSARGLGYEMAKCFRRHNFNVVISDIFKKDVDEAKKKLLLEKGKGDLLGINADITSEKDIIKLISESKKKFHHIDYWINNAGINQPDKMIWEMNTDEISKMIEVDLKGTMIASKYIMEEMITEGHGNIYTVLGHGSNDAIIPGLSIYGTMKRGLTYFMRALAKEAEVNQKDIIVGRLSPGIMITDFIVNSFRDNKIELSKKNKKVYNILGDYPDKVANYLVRKIISNTNNDVIISWLPSYKAAWRFMTSWIRRRDFFKEEKIGK